MNVKTSGSVLVVLAGIFWGSMGIFVRGLSAYGFSPIQIVSLRMTVAALVFILIPLFRGTDDLKIRLRDLPLFLGLGLASVLFFTICYFSAIEMMTLSAAAILLYTSPIWVMLMSLIFFRERLGPEKLLALALAFSGCVLVSGLGGGGLSPAGLLIGLGSGIGYGLYSILGTVALRRYSPYTVTACTFAIAGVGSWFVCAPGDMLSKLSAAPALPPLLLLIALAGLLTAVIPFLLYTLGLQRLEASRAAILATVEPMVATLIGVLIYNEPLSLSSGAGIALILAAIFVLNIRPRKKT